MFKCLWSEYSTEAVKIYIVDGQEIRDTMDVNFTEGGHDIVYGGGPLATEDFIPAGEVWIESDGRTSEMLFSLLHELHERNVMLTSVDYDSAHDAAIVTETAARENPETLDDAIRSEMVQDEIVIMGIKGGEGSGNHGHAGRPGEVGGSGPGGGDQAGRRERAKASHVAATASHQRQAEHNEATLAERIGGKQQTDNSAFDVVRGNHAIEVKTIVSGKNDKITMHPDSLNRKLETAKSNGWQTHTVVFDDRVGQVYYRPGVGSFRLGSMTPVSVSSLRAIIKGVHMTFSLYDSRGYVADIGTSRGLGELRGKVIHNNNLLTLLSLGSLDITPDVLTDIQSVKGDASLSELISNVAKCHDVAIISNGVFEAPEPAKSTAQEETIWATA